MVDVTWLAASNLGVASFSTSSTFLRHLSLKPFSSPISVSTIISSHHSHDIASHHFNSRHEGRSSHKSFNPWHGYSAHALGFPFSPPTRVRAILERTSALPNGSLAFLQTCCLTNSMLSDAGGGNFGSSGGGESWGGDGEGGGNRSLGASVQASSGEADDTDLTPKVDDEILLQVKGMSCGGCASAVKKILESQPEVISATVDLAREVAYVHVKSVLGAAREWGMVKTELGHSLASSLTSSGFKSSVKVDSAKTI